MGEVKDPMLASDLRPVSVQPVISRVFETLVARQFRVYIDTFSVLPVYQSGFRSEYRCASPLLSVCDAIFSGADRSEVTAVGFQ